MRSKVWWWTPPLHGLNIEREARSIYFWPIHASQHAVLTISRELWVRMKKVWLIALLLHSTPFGLLKYFSNFQWLLIRLKNFDSDSWLESSMWLKYFQFLHSCIWRNGSFGRNIKNTIFQVPFQFCGSKWRNHRAWNRSEGFENVFFIASSQQLYSWRSTV